MYNLVYSIYYILDNSSAIQHHAYKRIEKNIHLERHTTAESVIWIIFSNGKLHHLGNKT